MRALLLLPLVAACSCPSTEDYPDYTALREKAATHCRKLGHHTNSPAFFSCVGKEYTRLKQEKVFDNYDN